jgi:hypothetical protein
MLTSTPLITLTAKTVQRVAELGDAARVFVSRPETAVRRLGLGVGKA